MIKNQRLCQGLTNSRMKAEGTAPMKGPKKGMTLVMPMTKLIRTLYSSYMMFIRMKQMMPMITESTILPTMKPPNLLAVRSTTVLKFR